MATTRPSSSPLDLLSGVALVHEPRTRTPGERDTAAVGPRSTTTRAAARASPPRHLQHSRLLHSSSADRVVPSAAPALTGGAYPTPTALLPPPRPRTRLPFPSAFDLPPTTPSLVTRPGIGAYGHSDAPNRAVARRPPLMASADGPLASLLAAPRSTTISAPFAAPERSQAPSSYGPSHVLFPGSGGPSSVAMVRQQQALPSGFVRPSGAASASAAPIILCPPVFPPLSTTTLAGPARAPHSTSRVEQGVDVERDEPSPVSPPDRNALFAIKASIEPSSSDEVAEPSLKAGKKASGCKKAKPAPRPLSSVKLSKRVPRDMDGCDPIVSCTLWEDERTVAMQVLVEGHVVARRADNNWVNATKIVNMVPGMTRGKRDTVLKTRFGDSERMVFRRGALHLKGVWVPLQDAVELAHEYDLYDRLYPLFEDNICSFLFRPVNKERTRLLVVAARERAALCRMPDASSGLSQGLREELRIRGEELERLLQCLEAGLGVPAPSGSSSAQAGARSSVGGRSRHGVAQEQPQAYVAHDSSSREPERRPSPTAFIVDDTREPTLPPTPPTPPPSGGFLRSTRQQQGLAATYRTRFGYPPDGPPPPDNAVGRPSSSTWLPASSSDRAQSEQGPSLRIFAASAPSLSQRPHTAPASALDCVRRSSIDSTSGPSFSWFDNPTPPEQSLDEYFAPAGIGATFAPRRRSQDSSGGENGIDGDSRSNGATASAAESSFDSDKVLGQCGGATTLSSSGPASPLSSATRAVHGRSLSLPTSVDDLAMGGRMAPLSLDKPASMPQAAALEEPADYPTFVAGLVASLRSPTVSGSASPLSRFSATRLSVDGAVDIVGSRMPPSFRTDFAPRTPGSWMASALGSGTQDDFDRTLLCELLGGRDAAAEPTCSARAPRASSTLAAAAADVPPVGESIFSCQPLCDADVGVGLLRPSAPHVDGAAASCAFPPTADLGASARVSFGPSPTPNSHKRPCTVADAYPSFDRGDSGANERAVHARTAKKARLAGGRGGGEGSGSTS